MSRLWYYVRHIAYIIVIISILFTYAMLRGSFISWFLFYSFLPILIYQLLFVLYPLHHWRIERTLSKTGVEAGSHTTVTLTMTRKFPFPIFYVVFEELLPASLMLVDEKATKYVNFLEPYTRRKVAHEKNIVYPFFRRTFKVSYTLHHLPRGVHRLTNIRVRSGDMFGIFKKREYYSPETRLIIYPSTHLIQFYSQLGVTFQGTHGTNQIQIKNTNDFASVRQYMPGDRFSWIHWKQTAKQQDIMTKEFEQQKSTDVLIVLDACLNGRDRTSVFDIMIEYCYSFVMMLSRHFLHVSFYSIGNKSEFISNVESVGKSAVLKGYLASLQQEKGYFSKEMADNLYVFKNYNPIFFVTLHVDNMFIQIIETLSINRSDIHVFVIQSYHHSAIKESLHYLVENNISHTVLTEEHLSRPVIEVNL